MEVEGRGVCRMSLWWLLLIIPAGIIFLFLAWLGVMLIMALREMFKDGKGIWPF